MDQAEHKGLIVSTAAALTVGCVGIVFSKLTGSQAILLDGAFNLVYFIVSLLTIKVSKLVFRGDDERFPAGYSFFEPLVNGVKGVLILGISAMALFDAFGALFAGGRAIAPGMAIIYGVFAAVTCWTAALVLKKQSAKSSSPLLRADAESWIVNAAISSAVLLTFIAVSIISKTSLKTIVPYIDPVLVILVSAITINVPVKIAWTALMGLINRAPPKEVRDEVEGAVHAALSGLDTETITVRVLKPGRVRMVWAHVLLAKDADLTIDRMDELRGEVELVLLDLDDLTLVDVLFTKDPKWSARISDS